MTVRRTGMGSCAGTVICTLAVAMLLASFSFADQKPPSPSKANSAGAFDTPIKKVTVDLGLSPDYPGEDIRDSLSCYYFPNLMIKQYDQQANIGAVWLSMLRSRDKLPACKPSHEPGERVVKWPSWGEGYFWGVKDNLVFFSCPEVQQGDCVFAVYDSTTGKELFAGNVALSGKNAEIHMKVFSTNAGIVAKYLAAADAGCDLYAKGTDCWKKVKAKFGLKSDRKPVCEGYPAVYKFFETDQVESMIGYPVEVTFSPHPAIKTVAGPIHCWPTH